MDGRGKASDKQARYGSRHRARRRVWAPIVATGELVCPRCGEFIEKGQAWDLDHLPNGGSAPSHRSCNRATLTHARQAVAMTGLKTSRDW